MPYFEVQLPGNDMLPVALPKTTQTNYLQICLPEFQTPVRVVKVISTPILGFAGKMFCLYHLRGLSSFLDFLWIISAAGKLPEISPQTPGIMFLSPSVDGGVAGGLCDVVQLVVGFLKVGRCRSRAPSTCPGPGGAWTFFVRLSSLLFVLKKCIFSEHRVYPQLKKPSLVGGVATPPKKWVRLDHHPNSWGNNGKFLKAMF